MTNQVRLDLDYDTLSKLRFVRLVSIPFLNFDDLSFKASSLKGINARLICRAGAVSYGVHTVFVKIIIIHSYSIKGESSTYSYDTPSQSFLSLTTLYSLINYQVIHNPIGASVCASPLLLRATGISLGCFIQIRQVANVLSVARQPSEFRNFGLVTCKLSINT